MTAQPVTADDFAREPLSALAERYGDLNVRSILGRRATADAWEPLTPDEHAELLAIGEAIRRHVTRGRQCDVRAALLAGTGWAAICAALGVDQDTARADYLSWVDVQSWLWDDLAASGNPWPLGLSPADRDKARALALPGRPA